MFKPQFRFPKDCLKLVHSGDSFVFKNWARSLENVFRVSGITDALGKVGLTGREYVQPLKIVFESLDARVPKEWKAFYNARSAWTPLGDPQITKNLQKSLPQSFDRALLSIVYVAEFIERVQHEPVPEDYLDLVKIVPVPYHFDLPKDFWSDSIKGTGLVERLQLALHHEDDEIIKLALKEGCRMTWRTASIIKTVLAEDDIELTIRCSPGKKPWAIPNEPLYPSRKVAHPSVKDFLRVQND
jgi:hypothetical protein